HMAVAFEYVMEMLGEKDAAARRLDPAGDQALKLAKRMRRQALHEGGREDPERMLETAEHHFGLPTPPLAYWKQSQAQRPWRDREQDYALGTATSASVRRSSSAASRRRSA